MALAAIRRIHFTTPQAERERLAADLIACYERGEHQALLAEVEALLPKNEAGKFLAFQPGDTGAEEKSDVAHDLLAHLAERMIEMHKQKQARVEAFWDELIDQVVYRLYGLTEEEVAVVEVRR